MGIILVPLVLYQTEQVITANVLVEFMKKWVHAEDKLAMDEESGDREIVEDITRSSSGTGAIRLVD